MQIKECQRLTLKSAVSDIRLYILDSIAVQNIVEKVYGPISESKNDLRLSSDLSLTSMSNHSSELRPPLRLRSHRGGP